MAWLSVLLVLLTLRYAEATTCNIGTASPSSYISDTDALTNMAVFVQGAPSPCCGLMKNWMFHANGTGDLKAQHWRETADPIYELVSQEVIPVTDEGYSSPTVTSVIQVKIGDIIGWEVDATEIIPYSVVAGPDYQTNSLGSVPVGSTASWGLSTDNTRTYAFGAVVTNNTEPEITDLDVTHDDTDTAVAGFTLGTLAVTDAETAVNDLIITLETHTLFVLDGLDVKTNDVVPEGVYTLWATVEDHCGTVTGSVTVTVNGVAPVIDNPADTHGSTYADNYSPAVDEKLTTITVTDTNQDSCATTHTNYKFVKVSSTDYDLYMKAGAILTPPQEVVDITCTDLTGLTDTGTYTVPVSNAPPVFTAGLPGSTSIHDETGAGTSLHTFSCEDPTDTTTVNIVPANPLFTIVDSSPSFEIRTNAALNFDSYAPNPNVLMLECTDSDSTVTQSYSVTVTDKPPVVTDLPGAATANLGTQDPAYALGPFTCSDGNDPCTCSVDDTARFEIVGTEPNFELWVKQYAVFGPGASITVVITCTDGNTPIDNDFVITLTNTVPTWDTPPGNSAVVLPDDTVGTAVELGSFTLLDPETCNCVITDPAPGTHPYELQQVTTVDPQDSPPRRGGSIESPQPIVTVIDKYHFYSHAVGAGSFSDACRVVGFFTKLSNVYPEWKVWTKATVTEDQIDYDDGAVELIIECDDTVNTAINGTFIVQIEDVQIDVQGLPGTDASLPDNTDSSVVVGSFTVVDGDDNARINCVIDPAYSATTTNFEVVQTSLGPPVAFDVQTITTPTGFNAAAVPQYVIPIQCDDGENPVVTKTKTVNMLSAPPAFTAGLPNATTIDDETGVGTSLHTFSCEDPTDTTTVNIVPANPLFTIVDSSPSFEIQVNAALNFDSYLPNPQIVVLECMDSASTVTESFTVTVTDKPPVVGGLPGAGTANEGTQAADGLIGPFNCTDGNDPCACTVDDTTRFEIQGTEPDYELWVKQNAVLAPGSSPITVVISCTDGNTNFDNDFVITLVNTGPTWDTPPGISDVILPDDTVGTAVELGSFTLLDPETCNCVITDPAPGTHPYELEQVTTVDPQVWKVWTKASVAEDEIDNDDGTVELIIECTDGTNPPINGTFTVQIEDVQADIQGLPGTDGSLSDDTASSVVVGSFTVVDGDDNDRINCTIDPSYTASTNFEVVKSTTGPPVGFDIQTISNPTGFDAIAEPQYVLPIQCVDGTNLPVSESKTVNMINAPPFFEDLLATQSHGSTIPDSQNTTLALRTFTVNDTQPVSCTASAPPPFDADFNIDDTAAPVFVLELLDTNNLHFDDAEFVDVTIECTDTVTPISAIYEIQVTDTPSTLGNLPGTDYTDLQDSTDVGFVLDTFTCTDSDDICTCYIDPADTAATDAFNITAGASDTEFEIWLKDKPVGLDAAVTPNMTLPIECTDGNNVVTGNKTVHFLDTPPGFQTLDAAGTIVVQVEESETTRRVIYTEYVDDTTKLYCYRTDPKNIPGILLNVADKGPPSAELEIILQENPNLDFEGGPGFMSGDFTCEDKTSAVTRRLTIEILNSAPSEENPGGSYTLLEYADKPKSLKTIKLEKYDKNEPCTLTDNDGGPFIMEDDKIIKFTAAAPLTADSYTLVYECTDAGGLSMTDTFIVNVQNEGPRITNPETMVTIREDVTDPDLVLELTTSELANNCYQTTSEPDYDVRFESGSWGIHYVGGADKLKRGIVKIKLQCMDDTDPGPEKTIYIKVTPNDSPKFTNLDKSPKATSIEVVAKETFAGDEVFQLESSDTEGDDVTYILKSIDPADCPFEVDAQTGKVFATNDLATYKDYTSYCTLSVMVNDTYNTPEAMDFVIYVKDPNVIPTWENMPEARGLLENRPVGHVIHTLTKGSVKDFGDTDKDDLHSISCEFPDGGGDFFECRTDPITNELSVVLIKEVDYETMPPRFHVDMTINDGYNDSAVQRLTINLLDVNEKPEFEQDIYYITNGEGKAGDVVGCPEYNIKDEDGADTEDLVLDCPVGAEAFVLDKNGCIRQTKEWDLDDPAKRLPSETIQCDILVFDSGRLTDQSKVSITIEATNDNSAKLTMSSYVHCAPLGSTSSSFSIPADDNDAVAKHRDLDFSLVDADGTGGTMAVDNSGRVTVGDVSGMPAGTTYKRTLRVTDGNGEYSNANIVVIVCDPPPVVVNTNNNNNNAAASSVVSSDEEALYWLIPAGLLLALMAGLLTFLCWRCYRNGKCGACGKAGRRQPKVTKVREAPPRRAEPRRARTPSPPPSPPPKPPAGTIPQMELGIVHFNARKHGNLGLTR